MDDRLETKRVQYQRALARLREPAAAPESGLVRDAAIQRFDLAITAPGITHWDWSLLQEALEEAPLLPILDVVRSEDITDPRLRAAIATGGQLIYRR